MRGIGAAFALVLTTVAAAQEAPEAISANYACSGGAVVSVAYLNPPGGPSLAVVGWAGRLIPMAAGPTGSGVRYVSHDPEARYVWHSKGEAGTLILAGAEDAAQDETILRDCRRIRG